MRNVLIISGQSKIFRYLAADLKLGVKGELKVFLACEKSNSSLIKLAKNRIHKNGFFLGINQLVMKLFDLLFFRYQIEKNITYKNDSLDLEVNDINSSKFRKFVLDNSIDIVVCVGTSIIRPEILTSVKIGFINIHPGYLPNYRGLGNFWAVVNKDWENLGVTCHWINQGIDTGEIIWTTKIRKLPKSYWELNLTSFLLGIDFLKNQLAGLEPNTNTISNYRFPIYPWFTLIDFIKFKRNLLKRRKENLLTRQPGF